LRLQCHVVRITGGVDEFAVHHTGGTACCRFVVVATGVVPATGGLSKSPNVLIGPGEHINDFDLKGKSIAILGGGDNAFENYAFARARGVATAHIYARTLRARKQFLGTTPIEDIIMGTPEINEHSLSVNGRYYDAMLVLYGWVPEVSFLEGYELERNGRGFFVTNPVTAETSVDGIYAIGEIARRMHPCCVTGMADGVQAAKAIQARLDAPDVRNFQARTFPNHSGSYPAALK
jgi:thioredoxin reductase (NADPH)